MSEIVPVTPMSLISAAMERDCDAERLGKLMELEERWRASRAAEAYADALRSAQDEMPVVLKEETNPDTKSKYANLEAVKRAIKPVYTKHGFTLSFGTDDSKLANHYRVCCDVRHTGGHTQRYFADFPADSTGPKGGATKTLIQGIGSMLSYAQRYLTCLIFDVVIAGKDDDGGAPLAFVTRDQIATLNTLIEDTGTDIDRFLAWAEAPALDRLTQGQFAKAVAMIRRKKGEK